MDREPATRLPVGSTPDRCSYVCQGASDGAGRPVMGHSSEGELLLGHAVSAVGWGRGRRIVRRTTRVGVGQLLGQTATPELGQARGSSW